MPVKATVAGEMGNVKFTASAINISSTGILIESEQPLNIRDIINCSFLLPGTLAISVTGEIVRILKKPAGNIHQYGIRFTSISASAQRIIEDFVKTVLSRRCKLFHVKQLKRNRTRIPLVSPDKIPIFYDMSFFCPYSHKIRNSGNALQLILCILMRFYHLKNPCNVL